MNWDAIGASGELLGAVAVILTLGYLALQVRQNTTAMRVAARLEITKQFADYTELLLLNDDLFQLNTKGLRGNDLDEVEERKFNLMLTRATWYFSSQYFQVQEQSLSPEEWKESRVLIDTYCGSPGFQKYWETNKYRFSSDFCAYLDERIKKS